MRQLRKTVLGSIPASYTDSVKSEGWADETVLNKAHKKYQKCLVWQSFMMTFENTSNFLFILWIEVRDEATEED